MSEAEASGTVCFKTIGTTSAGTPCLVRGCQAWERGCQAWERYDWTIEKCPHCGKDIRSQDDEPWGECRARFK